MGREGGKEGQEGLCDDSCNSFDVKYLRKLKKTKPGENERGWRSDTCRHITSPFCTRFTNRLNPENDGGVQNVALRRVGVQTSRQQRTLCGGGLSERQNIWDLESRP